MVNWTFQDQDGQSCLYTPFCRPASASLQSDERIQYQAIAFPIQIQVDYSEQLNYDSNSLIKKN